MKNIYMSCLTRSNIFFANFILSEHHPKSPCSIISLKCHLKPARAQHDTPTCDFAIVEYSNQDSIHPRSLGDNSRAATGLLRRAPPTTAVRCRVRLHSLPSTPSPLLPGNCSGIIRTHSTWESICKLMSTAKST